MNINHLCTLTWRGIAISISLNPDYSLAFKDNTGEALAYIEIRADEPLPITETGYRGLFLSLSEVDEEGGAVEFVKKWLGEAADSKEWKEWLREKMQYCLF